MKKKVNKYVIPKNNNNLFEKKQKEVNQLLKAKDYPKLIVALNELLEMDKNNIDTLNDLGTCYFDTEQYEKAIEYYQKILDIYDDNTTALINIANCYTLLNDYKKGISYAKTVLEIDDRNVSALFLIAILEFNNGNFPDSLKYFGKIISEYGKRAANLYKNETEHIIYISSIISTALINCENSDYLSAQNDLNSAYNQIKFIRDSITGLPFNDDIDSFNFKSGNKGIFTDYYYAYSLAIHKDNIDEAIININKAIQTENNKSDLHKQAAYYYYLKNEKELFRKYMNQSIELEKNKTSISMNYGKYYQAVRIPEDILNEMMKSL